MRFIVLMLVCIATAAHAANVYVGPVATGNGLGGNWTNLVQWSSSLSLVRGNTYYLTNGTYSGKTLSTSTSGTNLITIKKATQADHGTDVGWGSPPDGQAIFSSSSGAVLSINTSYWLIDGVTGTNRSGYGFVFNQTGLGNSSYNAIASGANQGHVTIRHCECALPDPVGSYGDQQFNVLTCAVGNDGQGFWTLQYDYIHGGIGCVYVIGNSAVSNVIDHCILCRAGGQEHSEVIGVANARWTTISYNILEDCVYTSTTYIEPQSNRGIPNTSTDPVGLFIYGNVFRSTRSDEGCNNAAALSMTGNETITNVRFYNNTLYNIARTVSLNPGIGCNSGGNPSTDVIVRNNVWESCVGNPVLSGVTTADHNYVNTGSGAPGFVNATSGDFHLTANTTPGVALSAPFDKDPDGTTRSTWSLGAYEFKVLTPAISVTPSAAVAPITIRGLTNYLTLTVSNAGGGTLTGYATNATAPFSLPSNVNYSLSAAATTNITVAFTPTNTSLASGTVQFTGGVGATNSVSGIGIPLFTNILYLTNAYVDGLDTNNGYVSQAVTTNGFGGQAIGAFYAPALSTVAYVVNASAASNANNSIFFNTDAQPSNTNKWAGFSLSTNFGLQTLTVTDHSFGSTNIQRYWNIFPGYHIFYLRGREADCRLSDIRPTVVQVLPGNLNVSQANVGSISKP